MTNQVPWNKIILEEFINLALLTKEEEMILRTRIYGWTVREQADKLNMSVSSVNRIIKRLKSKYDNVEKFSTILPPRKSSEKEKYLDEN
jgi:DNA-directed RNA polymerase specialized sigma24 family protein